MGFVVHCHGSKLNQTEKSVLAHSFFYLRISVGKAYRVNGCNCVHHAIISPVVFVLYYHLFGDPVMSERLTISRGDFTQFTCNCSSPNYYGHRICHKF